MMEQSDLCIWICYQDQDITQVRQELMNFKKLDSFKLHVTYFDQIELEQCCAKFNTLENFCNHLKTKLTKKQYLVKFIPEIERLDNEYFKSCFLKVASDDVLDELIAIKNELLNYDSKMLAHTSLLYLHDNFHNWPINERNKLTELAHIVSGKPREIEKIVLANCPLDAIQDWKIVSTIVCFSSETTN